MGGLAVGRIRRMKGERGEESREKRGNESRESEGRVREHRNMGGGKK